MENNDKIIECKLITKLHSILEVDPVITGYMKLAEYGKNEDYVPRYRDKFLRSSLLAIDQNIADNKKALGLYRRLITFYYSATFKTVNALTEVMQIFTKNEIVHIIADVDNILCSWDRFIRSILMPHLVKETFLEIMKEWAKRYEIVYARQLKGVKEQARNVLTYLYWDHKFLEPWLDIFKNTYLPKEQSSYTTAQQLDISVIINDIRDSLNPLIHKYVLSCLPLQLVDTNSTLPLRNTTTTTSTQEVQLYNDIIIKEEYTESNVEHGTENEALNIENAEQSFENGPFLASVELDEMQEYEKSFNGGENCFQEYDNSITALSRTCNKSHKVFASNQIFVISEIDTGEEVNHSYVTGIKRGIEKSTALKYLDELRLYALQTGLVEIIEKLNEIGTLIRRTRMKSLSDTARDYRQRKKQRKHLENRSREAAQNSSSTGSPAITTTTKQSGTIVPINETALYDTWKRTNTSKTNGIVSFPTTVTENVIKLGSNLSDIHNATTTGLVKPKKSNAARMREYRARKKLRLQQAAALSYFMEDNEPVGNSKNLSENLRETLTNTNTNQYNKQTDKSKLNISGLLPANELAPQETLNVRRSHTPQICHEVFNKVSCTTSLVAGMHASTAMGESKISKLNKNHLW